MLFQKAKSHRAFATNNFGAGHMAGGYRSRELAEAKALAGCEAFNRVRENSEKNRHRVAPCFLLASNNEIFSDNVAKVLSQSTQHRSIGGLSETWHGTYVLDSAALTSALGLPNSTTYAFVLAERGFHLLQGKQIFASGTYERDGDRVVLLSIIGPYGSGPRELVFDTDEQRLAFVTKPDVYFIKTD